MRNWAEKLILPLHCQVLLLEGVQNKRASPSQSKNCYHHYFPPTGVSSVFFVPFLISDYRLKQQVLVNK
jgi:hypothetical protein